MKRIILTGGGTAGHVTPNIALLPSLKKRNYEISYIGSYNGIEKKLIEDCHIPYYGISSGKLRRYFDPKNFTDPFRVLKGCEEAKRIIKKMQPDIVFSKGGFVSVPVVLAAKHFHIPVIIHESDMTPGLANRLAIPAACKVCCNFPETLDKLPAGLAVLSGSPIREELLSGSRAKALAFTGLSGTKPVLLVIGGSLGSAAINEVLRSSLSILLNTFEVIHLCGKGKIDPSLNSLRGYVQYEYISEELRHLLALADIVLSRAGANSICELLALKKPMLLIPLPAASSRGDQILNAHSFEKQGFASVLDENSLNSEILIHALCDLYLKKGDYIQAMAASKQNNAISIITDLLEEYSS